MGRQDICPAVVYTLGMGNVVGAIYDIHTHKMNTCDIIKIMQVHIHGKKMHMCIKFETSNINISGVTYIML